MAIAAANSHKIRSDLDLLDSGFCSMPAIFSPGAVLRRSFYCAQAKKRRIFISADFRHHRTALHLERKAA
jgi:hypothetical protein